LFGFLRPRGVVECEALESSQAATCARLHATAFAHPWSTVELESLITADNVLADAAFLRGKLAGFALSRMALDEAELLTIVVDRACRQTGVGKALLSAHVENLTRRHMREVFLEVDETNAAARRLYAAQDFLQVGRREAYYRQPGGLPTAALILRKQLF
jgi:ribosomal-protein-alanine N-acetyltransferase